MNAQDWQAEQFELNRPHLRAVAGRILGSPAEADDAVQEAWLRLNRSAAEEVENMRAWLTTVVSRICLDMLRARQARREELTDGSLVEPLVTPYDDVDPERQALIADSVGLALLVVLDSLAPGERLAFVLHDMFGVPFEEIAPIVERSVPATRQLASRARRRVRRADAPSWQDVAEERRVVDAFLEASRNGDFEALIAVLDPDVVMRRDAGIVAPQVPREIRGAGNVAQALLQRGRAFAPYGRPALVNGRPGAVIKLPDRLGAVVAFTIVDGRVTQLDLVADPMKLRNVRI